MLGLTLVNALPMLFPKETEKYLKYNFVKGVAVVKDNKIYTLNFDQQNEFIGYINRSKPEPSEEYIDDENVKISKIIVYLFDSPNIVIEPLGYNNNNLVYKTSVFNHEGLMKDQSFGKLKTILENSYD